MSILFKNGTVLDYASNTEEVFDVLISDEGKIEEIAKLLIVLVYILCQV